MQGEIEMSTRACSWPRWLGLLMAAMALMVLSPGAASAAIRHLGIRWPAPKQPRSITRQRPVTETNPYIHRARVSYNDATGAVTGSFGLYSPGWWEEFLSPYGGPTSPEEAPVHVEIDLATDCANGPPGHSGTKLTLNVAPADPNGDGFWDQASGDASLSGYRGMIRGPGTFDGTNYTVTLTSRYFAHRDFRCAFFAVWNMHDPSRGWFWLPGYGPVQCTNSRIGKGRYSTSASHETALGVSCSTVHRSLRSAWLWRWYILMWGGVPGTTPGRTAPKGWRCEQIRQYFKTGNRHRQDDGTITGSVTECFSGKKAFQVTAGHVTRWSHRV